MTRLVVEARVDGAIYSQESHSYATREEALICFPGAVRRCSDSAAAVVGARLSNGLSGPIGIEIVVRFDEPWGRP